MLFWTLSIGCAALAFLPVLAALLRPPSEEVAENADLAIYRDQLAEVGRDRDKGLLDAEEAARAELEVQRRLLDAASDRPASAGRAPQVLTGLVAGVLAAMGIGGTLGLYAALGAPGYPDLGLATRLEIADETRAGRISQAEAEARAAQFLPPEREMPADFAPLMARLRRTVETRPDDVDGLRLLARNEAALNNFDAAMTAQARVVTLLGDDAEADDLATLAETMVLAAGGFVSPEAEARLDAALARDAADGRARYLKGLALAQIGRPDLTFSIWSVLLEEGPADAPWIAPVAAQIPEIAARAGIRYDPPAQAPAPMRGPDADQMAAAAQMNPDDRQEMIETMVAGLSERLATEGGPAPDWARLITAYGVLGRADTARRIYVEAQEVFAGSQGDLSLIDEAAENAGIAE